MKQIAMSARILAGLALALPAITGCQDVGQDVDRVSRPRSEILAIEAALERYKADFGDFPIGNSSLIAQHLLGNNPKNRPYLEWRSGAEDGFLLDPWGRPYRISFSPEGYPIIRSLGEDVMDASDDHTNQ